jgi:hypothetical protein
MLQLCHQPANIFVLHSPREPYDPIERQTYTIRINWLSFDRDLEKNRHLPIEQSIKEQLFEARKLPSVVALFNEQDFANHLPFPCPKCFLDKRNMMEGTFNIVSTITIDDGNNCVPREFITPYRVNSTVSRQEA